MEALIKSQWPRVKEVALRLLQTLITAGRAVGL